MTVPPLVRLIPAILLMALAGCTFGRKIDVSHEAPVEKPLVFVPRAYHPSFDCIEAASIAQDEICGSPTLSGLDTAMAAAYRQAVRGTDLIGRDQLVALQTRWLVDRRTACSLPDERRKGLTADPAAEACLTRLYHEHIAALSAWPKPVRSAGGGHPIAAYVEFRGADYRDAGLCAPMQLLLQTSIQRNGDVDPDHLAGVTELAGTHGPARTDQPYRLTVAGYDGGADKSYERRAQALTAGEGGTVAIDQTILAAWIKQQENSGGRFFTAISDTKDFAGLDAIQYQGRVLALAVEPWGYFSPASIGEASYAGLFEIAGTGRAEPRCLFKTYSRPPAHGAFDDLPSLKSLRTLLDTLHGTPSADFDPNDRREAHLLNEALVWNLLNLPLIGTGEELQDGWAGWLRKRHDATLEAFFAWSERDLASKALYRRLIDLMRPASDELATTFRETQGLKPAEAKDAADLVLMALIEQGIGAYPGGAAVEAENAQRLVAYRPHFAVAPLPGDIESGRPIASLHSAVLNHAPADVIGDFIAYEYGRLGRARVQGATTETALQYGRPGHAHTRGVAGETALSASVETPEILQLLLDAGADPNETDAAHRTALMAAARFDRVPAAERLLNGGADPAAVTIAWTAEGPNATPMPDIAVPAGETALMMAAANAQPPLIRLLLDHGARPRDRDGDNHDACDYLARNAALQPADRAVLKPLLCP